MNLENKINIFKGDAIEILPTFSKKYDLIFIDAAKRKISIFLKRGIKNVKAGHNNYCG